MVIEWLRVRVPAADQARFIAMDAQIWTEALAGNAGFLGKEVWRGVEDADVLNLVIRWRTKADWAAVPRALLDETERRFRAAMGAAYPVEACVEYEVLGDAP